MEELKKEPVTASLILINVIVFLLVDITGDSENTAHMLKCGAAYAPYILEKGEYYRIFTCMFLHFGMEHLLSNMLVLFVLGQRLEPVIGKVRLLLVYLLGGLSGNIISLYLSRAHTEYAVAAGASGAVFALMGAMVYVLLRHKGKVQDLSARQILIMAVFSLLLGFMENGVDNAAHMGGFFGGFLLALLLYHPRKIRNTLP